ncbi:hypothetical protein Ndes2526B_g07098 [Nannochloris sp. 'desiccata']
MHPSPQEAHSPAIGHLEEREGHTHGGSNPKLGRRIKAAASSFATKLHIPGTGHPSAHTSGGGGPGLPAVEHHRVTVQHVASETLTQRPQWQVEEPHYQFQQQKPQEREIQQQPQLQQQQQRYHEMPPSPATPLRDIEKETTTLEPRSAQESHVSASEQTDVLSAQLEAEVKASTSSTEAPSGTAVSNELPQSSVTKADDPHQGAGSPTIHTPFFGIESPTRLSSDTDELKPTYIKPLPSLDRSTESQEVYVEDLETLVDEKGRAVGAGRVDGKSAAERLKHAGPALQEIEEEEEEHTDAGPSSVYSSYAKVPRQETGKDVGPVVAAAGGGAALASTLSTKEQEKRSPEVAGASSGENKDQEQENLEEEIYAAIEAEDQFEKEEEEEDQAIASARRRVEIEEAEGRGHPKAMTHPLESPSGKIVIPALEVPDTIAVPKRRGTGRDVLQAIQTWVLANPILLFLLIVGTVSLTRAAWVFFSSSSSTFKEFGPLLLVSGAVALVASVLATYTMTGGTSIVPLPERGMAGLDAPDITSTAGGGGGGGGGEPLDDNLPPREQPGPSEPVSKESTGELVQNPEAADPASQARQAVGQRKEEGVLHKVEHAVGGAATAAKEKIMGGIDPGQEMVGEVTQETDTGGKILLPDTEGPVHRAEDAVVHTAEKIKNIVVRGPEKGTRSDPAAQKSGAGGYSSDSDVSGPVIEGVHPVAKDQGHLMTS